LPAEIHIPQPESGNPAELAMIARLRDHPAALIKTYLAMYKNNGVTFIARDAAKKLFPEYNDNPTVNNRYSDQSASALAEAVRLQVLSNPPRMPRNELIFVTGTPASGKSVSAATISGPTIEIVHETIFTALDKAAQRVQQAIDAKRLPQIVVVYTNDPRINVRRMIDRARLVGRTVPLQYMAQTYVGVPEIVKQLHDHFGTALLLTLMNNSGAVREVVIHHDVRQLTADIGFYNSESCLRVMDDELSQIDQENPIPPEILHQAKLRDDLR
jgi:Tfp pilus assembly pilus retraction ATPase PilT